MVKLTYEKMQGLRDEAFAKGKTTATRQKAFEVLRDAYIKSQEGAKTTIDVEAQ